MWGPYLSSFLRGGPGCIGVGESFLYLEIFWFEHSGRFIVHPKLLYSPTAMPGWPSSVPAADALCSKCTNLLIKLLRIDIVSEFKKYAVKEKAKLISLF